MIDIIESVGFNAVTDIIMCLLSMFLTYILYNTLNEIKGKSYSFGSTEWFNRIEQFWSICVCLIGSIGLSIVTSIHSFAPNHLEEITETLADVFIIMILFSAISRINNFRNKHDQL